jgi:hypothetical protein
MAETKELEIIRIRPQEGYQMKALSSGADIVIGGSGAGVGKTYCLLLEFLRHINNPEWGGVIFRRTSPQINSEGGLWDTSEKLYPHAGGTPVKSNLRWDFEKGAKLKFSHLEYEKDKNNWQGSQIPFIGFDELTHFTESMFFYLLSRSRSTCGVKPYVRATCNPDPDSWVAKLIEWWIDQDSGLPIPERDGKTRYFYRDGSNYVWGDTKEEVLEKARHLIMPMVEKSKGKINPDSFIKSLAFVSGSIYENEELLSINPEYLANLASQDEATKAQLLDGNWKVQVSDQEIYDYYRFIQLFDREPEFKEHPKTYVTADIAMKGSNKLIIGGWVEQHLKEIEVVDKSNGKEVLDAIQKIQKKLNVPNNHVAYDADGVGSYIDGFIVGSVAFNNGASPMGKVINSKEKPNYPNLKTQCYYESATDVNDGLFSIDESVGNKMYDDKMTIRQRFIYERKAIKRAKADNDGKLMIIPKEQMKILLDGDSPDLMDMFMMRKVFDLKPKTEWKFY